MNITQVNTESLAHITRAMGNLVISSAPAAPNTANSSSTTDDPEFKAFNTARENLSRTLNRLGGPNPPSEAEVKAAFEKHDMAKKVLLYKINTALSNDDLPDAKRVELIEILKTHLGITQEITDLENNRSKPDFNDMVSDIIAHHNDDNFDPIWLLGLQRYTDFSTDIGGLTSVISGATTQGTEANKMKIDGEAIQKKIQELLTKWSKPKNALFVSKKTGDEALKEVQERARELGMKDEYLNEAFPRNIKKVTNADGTTTYCLTVNLTPLRKKQYDLVTKGGGKMEISNIDHQTLTTAWGTQDELMKLDVTTFSTKTGDEKTKMDNLIKAMMSSLSSRLDNGKSFLSA